MDGSNGGASGPERFFRSLSHWQWLPDPVLKVFGSFALGFRKVGSEAASPMQPLLGAEPPSRRHSWLMASAVLRPHHLTPPGRRHDSLSQYIGDRQPFIALKLTLQLFSLAEVQKIMLAEGLSDLISGYGDHPIGDDCAAFGQGYIGSPGSYID